MPKTLEKEKLIAALLDSSRPFEERAGCFLQFTARRFQARYALLVCPLRETEWTIFSLRGKGRIKVSKKHVENCDLGKLFKNKPIISSGKGPGQQSRDFFNLFPDQRFVAVPVTGEGKKILAAWGIVLEDNEPAGKGEMRIFSSLAKEDLFMAMACVLFAETLKAKNRELVRSGHVKDDYYQMVAHDLKGPITEILANIDLLKLNPNLTPEDQEVVDTALCGCDSLFRMVAELLDINKMEEGKFIFSFSDFDLAAMARDKIERMKAVAAQKEIVFELASEPGIPTVRADEELVLRVLANLFSNAVTYSYSGQPISVGISLLKDKGMVQVSVRDRGEGIPKSRHRKIFEKFGQSFKAGTRKRYSTGLGLTFCKMAVESHGGDIWVESNPGEGSVFYFTLPVNPP
ncbi:MAG: HAMP domain-containing histidine kinase [Nitrospinae bacterium]|nr:HAMP domain-containing histidine kinase [Nitrospinota bacterium]